MSAEILLVTFGLCSIIFAMLVDRGVVFGRRDREAEIERRAEERFAQYFRTLESRPERRPAVTRTRPEPPEPPAAAPVPVPEPNPEPDGAREEPEPEPETPPKKRSRREDLQAAAKELRAKGMSYRKIGEALGVAEETARRYVNNLNGCGYASGADPSLAGLDRAARVAEVNRLREEGESYHSIARRLGVSTHTAFRDANPSPKPTAIREVRADLEAEAKRLRATGMTYRQIGEAIGVSDETARKYANGLDRTGRSQEEPQTELDLAPKKKRARRVHLISITKKNRPELIEKAKMMHSHGISQSKIAEVLQISRSCVGRYIRGEYPGAPADRHQGEGGES